MARGDLPITVTERGNLESQDNVKILCEIDDIQGDNVSGTAILWIIPNGSSVKKGDLLVEFDIANHQERLDQQILNTDQARAEKIKSKAKYENQKTQNKTTEANVALQLELAILELEMFKDPEKGTHELEKEEIKRLIEDVNNEILAAQANLELKKNDKLGSEELYKLGYAGKSEVDRSRLEYLQAESAYAAKMNKLKTQLAILDKKEDYEKRMQLLTLQGAVDTADRNLMQAGEDNRSLLEQAAAASKAADDAFDKEMELLERYREQVGKAKIEAPQDGMVAYAVRRDRHHAEISLGAPVRPRQHIVSLPNLKEMQVQTAVHESVLDEVKAGLPVTVRVDAFPNRSYRGSVQSVAVLPDQGGWMSSDTKIYKTTVTIDEEVAQLKPGMSAVVEIHVARLKDVLSVPVQAVMQIQKESWCYVGAGRSVERRVVQLGRTNGKFVEIRKGLDVADRVVLNPMAIMEEASQNNSEISPEEDSQEPGEDDRPKAVPSEDADEASQQRKSASEGDVRGAAKVQPGPNRQPGRGPDRREGAPRRPRSGAGAPEGRPRR
jgi:RND family efflux transporter MFP subunit